MEHVVLLWFAIILVGVPTHVTATCTDILGCVIITPRPITNITTKADLIQFCDALPQLDGCLKAALPTCSETSLTSLYASALNAYEYLCSAVEQHGDYWECIFRDGSIKETCPFSITVTPDDVDREQCSDMDEYFNCLCGVIGSKCGQEAATFYNTFRIKFLSHLWHPHCSSLVGQPTTCGGATSAPPGTTTNAPSGAATPAPPGTTTIAPSGAATTAPPGTTTIAPSGAATTAPPGTTTTAPSGVATTARPAASLAQATLGGLVVPALLLMLLRRQ